MPEAVVIHCSCPDAHTAASIATSLVDSSLAACVQQLPGVRSTYRWNGRVEHADETLLLIKTSAECTQAVFARVGALHPHAVPELIALAVHDAAPAYRAWIASQGHADA